MRKYVWLVLPVLFSAALLAQPAPPGLTLPGSPLGAKEELVKLTLQIDSAGTAAGAEVSGSAIAEIAEEWHVNSARPKDDFAIPTELRLVSDGIEIQSIEYPAHIERAFEFIGGEKLAVYEGAVRIPFRGTRSTTGATTLEAVLFYQACNDRVCLPPREAKASLQIAEDGAVSGNVADASTPTPANFTPLAEAPPAAQSGGSLFSSDLGATFASRGLPLTLLVIFVLGLALNLTPCVYPLIPITVGYFSSQKEGSRGGQALLASTYVLGLAVTYSALGVFSALSGRLFGSWLQHPMVLLFFAALMLVLASSMFGAWEIRVPHFISDRAGARTGAVGALSMGLLAGVVAAPCVGPFIISLIALVGQSGSVPLGLLLFFVLSLGLGLPYLVLGIFSSRLNALPRSGAWMVQIKQAMGFILVAMAFYFLRPLTGEAIFQWGVGLSLLIGAGFLFLRRSAQPAGSMVRRVAALLLLVGGVWFVWPREVGATVQWTPFQESAIEAARVTGKPVMIDFYADWCIPCKELDAKTFTDDRVVSESERFVRLKADLTSTGDEKTRELSDKFKIIGVPTIVFIDSEGRERVENRLTGYEPPDDFHERMARVQ